MGAFDPLDSWFEKGFRIRQQKAARTLRNSRRDAVRGSSASRGSVKLSSNAKTNNAKSVIRKAPEVVVKITGNSNGLKTVKNHLEYISRNGKLELINESGDSIKGLSEIRDLRQELKSVQIPQESNKREFLHVIFSMPNGTPEKELRQAVSDFCKEEFSNRRYVMAFHDDTDKPHVHLCVSTRDFDRVDEPRLNPRKADLFRWRMGFADKLRELGVDAAASDRSARFNYKKSEKSAIRQIRADNPSSNVFNARRHDAKLYSRIIKAAEKPENAFIGPLRPPRTPKVYDALKNDIRNAVADNKRPNNPAVDAIKSSQEKNVSIWSEVARRLQDEGNTDLSNQVKALIREGGKEFVSRNQALFDLKINLDKNKELDSTIDVLNSR